MYGHLRGDEEQPAFSTPGFTTAVVEKTPDLSVSAVIRFKSWSGSKDMWLNCWGDHDCLAWTSGNAWLARWTYMSPTLCERVRLAGTDTASDVHHRAQLWARHELTPL